MCFRAKCRCRKTPQKWRGTWRESEDEAVELWGSLFSDKVNSFLSTIIQLLKAFEIHVRMHSLFLFQLIPYFYGPLTWHILTCCVLYFMGFPMGFPFHRPPPLRPGEVVPGTWRVTHHRIQREDHVPDIGQLLGIYGTLPCHGPCPAIFCHALPCPAMRICCLGKSWKVMESHGKSESPGPKQLDLSCFQIFPVPQELPDEPLFKDNLDFIPQAARGETEWKGGWTGMPWGKGFVQPASFMWDMGACLKLQNMIENPRLWKILESSESTCSYLFLGFPLKFLIAKGKPLEIVSAEGASLQPAWEVQWWKTLWEDRQGWWVSWDPKAPTEGRCLMMFDDVLCTSKWGFQDTQIYALL